MTPTSGDVDKNEEGWKGRWREKREKEEENTHVNGRKNINLKAIIIIIKGGN